MSQADYNRVTKLEERIAMLEKTTSQLREAIDNMTLPQKPEIPERKKAT